MKITKFEHACFIVEHEGRSLIVDPGGYSNDLVIPENVVAVVVTHEHADHFNHEHLEAIATKNPDVVVLGHEIIAKEINNLKTQTVGAGQGIEIGGFHLEFFGGEHAVISKDWPVMPNLGVMINDILYFPGDSFTLPEKPVEVLALPISAPWLKLSESMEFLSTVKPKIAFPTHDAILSEIGQSMCDGMLVPVAEAVDTKYQRLHEPLEI